ncbi:MAG: T9SS type A sorting domain-containing protein [Bacteroidetes bacterium]|jgi:photosystem II stability/assembly factor-like uncharacterized protein|nr:T9SS type A sorting domain-containing protein [Bacteroidota bacterium]MBT5530978.1 T9SS type A sorting domain-containing protein [Cytophagia bacterium]MBT3933019.1 T9SS type A sorting domain-containing protein [Bacteroidota bacterium]MBT4339450.1 T9SS type A sorting domain-containing protein [Bacteroidota bacterium]MBT4728678.1 T9SS type A sorting domain-containing protein [Bacteroidota bacterium]
MKKIMILILLVNSLFAHAQWSDITPKQWGSGGWPQMLDSLNFYCITGDTVSPWQAMIIKTEDGGKSWTELCRSFTSPVELINDYIVLSKDSVVVFTHLKNIYVASDSGKTFQQLTNVPTGLQGIIGRYNFYSKFSKTIFIMTYNAGVYAQYKTEDFGQSWLPLNSDEPGKFAISQLNFINSKVGYSIGADFILFKTTDNGSNWIKVGSVPSSSGTFMKMQFVTESIGFYGNIYGIYKTTDGGKSWTKKIKGIYEINSSCWPTDMYFSDENNGWVVTYCGGSYHYYRTEDGGLNWGRLEFSLSSCKMAYITGFDKNNLTLWPYNGAKCVYRTNNGGGPYSGVNEKPDVENSIRIFPNPANNTLTISLNRETIKHAKAFIINLQGQTLLQSELVGKENSLDISNLPAGVYFVKVVDENGVWIEKVVKE